MSLTEDQILRYSRQIILKDVGGAGQQKIRAAKVLIIGAGGLGAPAALYLAAAGVGTIGIVDPDRVDLSNLQRQIIHFTPDVHRPKVESAKEKINLINPDVHVVTYETRVYSENITEIIQDYDFIIDGTDNFPTKFLVNDACVLAGKPFSHAGILRFEGQTMTYVPGHTCYRCVFLDPPPKGAVPSCSEAGILGAVAGILGTIQAAEALRFIIGKGELLTDHLLTIDALNMEFRKIEFKKNPECRVCSEKATITELIDYQQPTCDFARKGATEAQS